MNVVAQQPIGAIVTDVSLLDADLRLAEELIGLLAVHGVLVLPDQHIDDETFLHFLRTFGELTFSTGETPVDGFPDLNVISNVGRSSPPKSTFHVDTSYVSRPPAFTALRAVTIPEQGGETLFTNQYLAAETLSPELIGQLAGRRITHVVTGLDLGPEDESSATHPVLREHPVSRRTALYLSTPQRCVAVSGLSAEDGRELVKSLFEHSTAADNIFRHSWRPGDVVIWDNACVLHRADHDHVVGDRVMHRGMVASRDTPRHAAV